MFNFKYVDKMVRVGNWCKQHTKNTSAALIYFNFYNFGRELI